MRSPPTSARSHSPGFKRTLAERRRQYRHRLLAAVNQTKDRTPANQGLIEPLSQRELDVLQLLGTDLDGPDIARGLIVSLNTVRTHTRNIYAKLGVNNRRAAVIVGKPSSPALPLVSRSYSQHSDRAAEYRIVPFRLRGSCGEPRATAEL